MFSVQRWMFDVSGSSSQQFAFTGWASKGKVSVRFYIVPRMIRGPNQK
jgi:hypothetical protein